MLAGPQISLKFQCEYYVFTLPGLHVHSIVVTPDGKKRLIIKWILARIEE